MKRILIASAIVLLALSGKAQQDPVMNQYLFCGMNLNPAMAGKKDYVTAVLTDRHQWVRMPGAPNNGVLSVHGPLGDNMGLGVNVSYDRVGVTNRVGAHANYAYKLKFSDNTKLAFGVKAGMFNYSTQDSELVMWDEADPNFNQNNLSGIVPSFGFGTYFQTGEYFVGLSIPTLLAHAKGNSFSLDVSKSSFLDRHYYLLNGYNFELNDDMELTPSVLVKYVHGAPIQADINCQWFYKKMFMLGLGYRTGDALVVLSQFQTNIGLKIGYGFDLTMSDIAPYQKGTHTIVLGYNFKQHTKVLENTSF